MIGKSEKIFWGLGFLLGAVALILSQTGVWPHLTFFSIVLTVFLGWSFLKGCAHLNYFVMLISLALLGCIYDHQLGIEKLTPWPIIGAAVLASIGLSIIFHKKPEWAKHHHNHGKSFYEKSNPDIIDVDDPDHVHYESAFGSTIKYINTDHFTSGSFEMSFGEMSVYFDNAALADNQGRAHVECSFGCLKLYIPKTWHVENHVDCSFGAVNEKNRNEAVSGGPVLYLDGDVAFGAVEIQYI